MQFNYANTLTNYPAKLLGFVSTIHDYLRPATSRYILHNKTLPLKNMKVLTKFLLLLCMLLLSGYSSINANSYQNRTDDSPNKVIRKDEFIRLKSIQNSHSLTKEYATTGTKREYIALNAEQIIEEKNESVFLKKNLETSKYFTVFNAILKRGRYHQIKNICCFRSPLYYSLSPRFILLQVIRV